MHKGQEKKCSNYLCSFDIGLNWSRLFGDKGTNLGLLELFGVNLNEFFCIFFICAVF